MLCVSSFVRLPHPCASIAHLVVTLLPFTSEKVKSNGGAGNPVSSHDAPHVWYMPTGARLGAPPSKDLYIGKHPRQKSPNRAARDRP